MPYIVPNRREAFEEWLVRGPGLLKSSSGDLNYIITRLCQQWLGGAESYEDYKDVIGILETVKLEFYRRALAPYEDAKIQENGDVY